MKQHDGHRQSDLKSKALTTTPQRPFINVLVVVAMCHRRT